MPPTFTPDIQPTILKSLIKSLNAYIYGAFTLYGKTNKTTNNTIIVDNYQLS